ncbi:MAG TPA: NAD-dependent epimerase/dehydratase family protein [Acidimicrobiales bacterium]|nr:NAD-dependent epimerase/dehydratase family protein [Acidimicrobiales bacterium]
MMITEKRTAAVSGAGGYLGTVIVDRLCSDGWATLRLSRAQKGKDWRRFILGLPVAPGLLEGVDLLVHCAYDMRLRAPADIWRVNVDGSRRLLEAACNAGVGRVIVVSSMSAFEGTAQLYGRAKLEIEAHAKAFGALSVRPGLVYGPRAGGMAGTLARLSRLPVVPLVAGRAYQFTVHEDDFAQAIAALALTEQVILGPVGVANPVPVPFRTVLERFARDQMRRCRFVPVDWRLVRAVLVLGEKLSMPLPVRSDSLLGLVEPPASVPNLELLEALGVRLRRFGQPVPPSG